MVCAGATSLRAGEQAARISVETHEGYMKTLSSTNAALGMKLTANDLAGAAKDAAQIQAIFADVEKFWAQNNKADGVKWAQDARQNATEMATALTAGDANRATAARKTMSGSCTSCHMTYREGTAPNYTLKAGVVTP
jgi:cytochrome c556